MALGALAVCAIDAVPAAAAPEDFRLAFVDVQKALSLSKAGKRAQVDYEGEVKIAQKDIDKKKDEFETRRKNFESQKDSLNEKALGEKQEELISLEKELKRSFQDSQAKLRRKNSQIVGDLIAKLRTVVGKVGKEKNFTMILEKSSDAVLYADSAIDITEEVVGEFDDQYK